MATRTDIETLVRAVSDHDTDTQVTTTQLNLWCALEYQNLRRELSDAVPSLYAATSATQALAAGDSDFTLPADFERIVRLERLVGAIWMPVAVFDGLSPHIDSEINVREEGTTVLKIESIIGYSYRLVYVTKPAALALDATVLSIPDGMEDVIVERVAARVRDRFRQDPTPHLARASDTYKRQLKALRRRYGVMPVPGLRVVRGW